ncbi:hypothetical protein [Magnetospirillum sp. LM-5]|uniref:hypothetical protein n=1 Tax=Magnetospirillum sp. LM-5 TaxID=2681466 RepID=UPI00156FA5D8|nr:hypothetical protein [Magnetospirillum sp. LM-5]
MAIGAKFKNASLKDAIWPKVSCILTAIAAAKVAIIMCYWIMLSYGFSALVMAFSGKGLYGAAPGDNIELYLYLFIDISIIILFWPALLKIKAEKFWVVPFISAWAFIELAIKQASNPGQGLVLSVIFAFAGITAFRGWLGIRRYRRDGAHQEEAQQEP